MRYRDRDGNSYYTDSSQDKFLRILYGTKAGRVLVHLLVRPAVSELGGRIMASKASRCMIRRFIRKNHLPMAEYMPAEGGYRSYNDFFIRQIRPEYRPVNMDADVLISPCDGKLSVYPVDRYGVFRIKHSAYTAASLLRDAKLAGRFEGGYCFVIRLTVDNYHHYCYVDDGRKSGNRVIPGIFHTVNPVACEHACIYKENTRAYTMLKTENFGRVIQMEVGAMMVGRIVNHHERAVVRKGQEKGYFEFGGSTVIVFVERNRVSVRMDILENMKEGYETIVQMGEEIAYKL